MLIPLMPTSGSCSLWLQPRGELSDFTPGGGYGPSLWPLKQGSPLTASGGADASLPTQQLAAASKLFFDLVKPS